MLGGEATKSNEESWNKEIKARPKGPTIVVSNMSTCLLSVSSPTTCTNNT